MSESLVCIRPPTDSPVSLAEFKAFLELPDGDTSRDGKLNRLLLAAIANSERDLRIRLITQTWLLRMDSFPGISVVYDRNGYPCIQLPFPPFQSIEWVKYIDTAGQVQTMPRDTSYGTDISLAFYCYQMDPGGGLKPARIAPMWARPWAPERLVLANTMVQFRCGYGGPLEVSTTQNSAVLSSPGFTFNPDDAPQAAGDMGTKICIPGAGAAGADLVTHVASVGSNGAATLATAASTAVTGVSAWLGHEIPEVLKLSILFLGQFFFEQGAVVDQAVPRVVESLRRTFYNRVS